MPSSRAPLARVARALALFAALLPSLLSCRSSQRPLLPRSQTWAELRTIRREVTVKPPEEGERPPYPRERLVDGEEVRIAPEGLAWLRRDGGATLLVRGAAAITLRSDVVEIGEGRVFVDTPAGVTTEIVTPGGPLHLAHVRASIDVSRDVTEVYVLTGEVRAEGSRGSGTTTVTTAAAGERLTITGGGQGARAVTAPVMAWDDWTGGLATTDRTAEPAPFGVGTVGARRPGEQGAPRFPLAIQRLDVRVRVEHDFAVTEVDEVFFNPRSEVVEGLYRFRTPEGAVLRRFGVDRDGAVMWGRVKEKQAAAAQYQSNVYQGSTEDPALLEWDAPGVYSARLYPVGPGETRRVVVSYAEWLGRSGPRLDRRLYVYPMAADGAEESLPHIEELHVAIDLAQAGARDVRAGMAGVREGDTLVVRDHDLLPRADLAVELFDEGLPTWRGYRAPHSIDEETLAPSERDEARTRARAEAEYVLCPIAGVGAAMGSAASPGEAAGAPAGIDLAIVVDTSAATEPASLALARAATGALLAHLGKTDRAVVWAGDASLRPVVPGQDKLGPLDDGARRAVIEHLATIERGGATDLGAMLAAAAQSLDAGSGRRGAVVYVGDGAPTVGELSLVDLRDRLAKLPRPVRIFGLGVGDAADMTILAGLARGAFAERVGDANAAARAALRLLEAAERPARLGVTVDLGPTVERVFPRDLGAIVQGEAQVVVGRLVGAAPTSVTVKSVAGDVTLPLQVVGVDDHGDLSRRWAEGRLGQLLDEGAGRAAMVDLGSRHGIITPVTSLYVPTKREMSSEERAELDSRRRQSRGLRGILRDRGGDDTEVASSANADTKEGGTGTRAKGEEGSMGNPGGNRHRGSGGQAQAAAAQAAPPAPELPMGNASPAAPAKPGAPAAEAQSMTVAREAAKREAAQFGMIGLLNQPSPPEDVSVAKSGGTYALGSDIGGKDDGFMSGFEAPHLARQAAGIGDLPSGAGAASTKPAKKPPEDAGWHAGKPGAGEKLALRPASVAVTVRLDDVSHTVLACSGAAGLPFEERIALWRERLAAVTGNPGAVAAVYRRSLAACEAPTWRERSRLLSMLLDALPSVLGKVTLWRGMVHDLGAADALYRGILARTRTPQELRALHDALGLRSIDPQILARIVKEAKTPGERAAKLRALTAQWPDDFALALTLLDALEDAGDDPGARELARRLRARPDADARLRTAVGELYLRLAQRAADPAQRALDEGEARRAFGEIVELAPEDPIARRRLGDLLRAHGWYAEAARQYETLARLTPDDTGVALLLAAAAEGQGKLEEAVKWTEKGGAAGAPDADDRAAHVERTFAATWLWWGRLEALAAGRADEASALAARLDRVRSIDRRAGGAHGGTRVTLLWAHPELHPMLWTSAPGAPVQAPEVDVTLGIAAATVPAQSGAFVEVRLDPDDVDHAARLGAEAVLTAVFDEGGANEKVVKTTVKLGAGKRAIRRFSLEAGSVKEVTQ